MVLDDFTFTSPLLSKIPSSLKNHQTLSNGIQFELNQYKTINNNEQNVTNNLLSWKDLLPQILASVVAFMLVTQPGMNMVYSNIFLNNYQFTDVSELSWLTSIMVICTPIGAIAIGVIMDRIGRKSAFLLTCVLLLISWSIASMARRDNMSLIYLCRFFAGIGGGMTSMAVVYVSEITHSSYKQVLLSLNSVFFSIGILFATTVGSLFQWQAVNMIFFIFTAITTVLSAIFLPESPVWLTKFWVDRDYEARSSLKRIYPKNDKLFAEEWDRLYYAKPRVAQETPVSVRLGSLPPSDRCGLRRFWPVRWPPRPSTAVTRPARVLATMFLLQQLSGCYPVIFYAMPIFQSVVDTAAVTGGLTEMDALITLGVVRLLTSVAACALSPHVGRRPLLICSSLAMACSATLVALTCPSTAAAAAAADCADYDTVDGGRPTALLPLFGVVAFVCSGSAGVLVFPWTLVGELLPEPARAVVGALLVAYAYALMFVVLKAFQYLVTSDLSNGGRLIAIAFATFATASAAMAVYVHVYLPETLGRRPNEIDEYFADSDAKVGTVPQHRRKQNGH